MLASAEREGVERPVDRSLSKAEFVVCVHAKARSAHGRIQNWRRSDRHQEEGSHPTVGLEVGQKGDDEIKSATSSRKGRTGAEIWSGDEDEKNVTCSVARTAGEGTARDDEAALAEPNLANQCLLPRMVRIRRIRNEEQCLPTSASSEESILLLVSRLASS